MPTHLYNVSQNWFLTFKSIISTRIKGQLIVIIVWFIVHYQVRVLNIKWKSQSERGKSSIFVANTSVWFSYRLFIYAIIIHGPTPLPIYCWFVRMLSSSVWLMLFEKKRMQLLSIIVNREKTEFYNQSTARVIVT